MKTIPEVVFLDPNDGIDSFASEADAPRAGAPRAAAPPVAAARVTAPPVAAARVAPPRVAAAPVAATTNATAVAVRQSGVGRALGLVSYALAGTALAISIVLPTTSPSPPPVAPRAVPTVLPGAPLTTVSENLTLAPLIDVSGLDVVDNVVTEPVPAVVPPAVKPTPVQTPPRAIETPPPPARVAAAPPPAPPVESRERTDAPPVATPPPATAAAPPATTTPSPAPVRPPAAATSVPAPSPPSAALAPGAAAPAPANTAPAPATAASAPAPAPAAAAATIERDVTGVQTALTRYRSAFSALDAREAVRVWPTVNAQNLSRAFERLESQEISFEGCQIDVHDARAEATCKGMASYVPRVGSRATRVERRQWKFNLVKTRDEWLIGAVDVR